MASHEKNLIAARGKMLRDQLRARGIDHPGVLEAFSALPRERFVPPEHTEDAYADRPLPIGYGQTISQPYIVALMVQALDPRPDYRILDIGAGSGYQTAILAGLVSHVYAIERIEKLTEKATAVLASLNVTNVTMCTGDGSMGMPAEAPFDGIICGAGGPDVPECWGDQLTDGGRIVMPVGGPHSQVLVAVEKHGDRIRRRELCGVRFVKLIGKEGWPED